MDLVKRLRVIRIIGLFKSIKNFDVEKQITFKTFANVCIERQILSVLSYARRKKHYYLNDSCSLDSSIDENGKTLLDVLFDDTIDPSLKVENDEENDILYSSLVKKRTGTSISSSR